MLNKISTQNSKLDCKEWWHCKTILAGSSYRRSSSWLDKGWNQSHICSWACNPQIGRRWSKLLFNKITYLIIVQWFVCSVTTCRLNPSINHPEHTNHSNEWFEGRNEWMKESNSMTLKPIKCKKLELIEMKKVFFCHPFQ